MREEAEIAVASCTTTSGARAGESLDKDRIGPVSCCAVLAEARKWEARVSTREATGDAGESRPAVANNESEEGVTFL